MSKGWIGVDLDGTLAEYDGWAGAANIGPPIPSMVRRVQQWVQDGHDVRIFTARVSSNGSASRDLEAAHARIAITEWCINHLGYPLPITNIKDYAMWCLFDDRAVQVQKNTGALLGNSSLVGIEEPTP